MTPAHEKLGLFFVSPTPALSFLYALYLFEPMSCKQAESLGTNPARIDNVNPNPNVT